MESMEGPKTTLLGMMEYKVCSLDDVAMMVSANKM
jgi:hypothetical protein